MMLIVIGYLAVGAICLWLLVKWVNRKQSNDDLYVPDHYEPRKEKPPPEVD